MDANIKYSGIDNLEVLTEAKRYNNFLKKHVIGNSRGAQTALDFGAGIGTFSIALRAMGLNVVCIETDVDLLNRLKNLGFNALLSLNDITDNSFDYIYSLNVLEHIEDDIGALKQLYLKLKPGGRVFLYVPAFNALYSSMDRKVGHFRRYRKSGLTQSMNGVGFNIEKAVYVDSLGFFATLIFKLIGNDKGDLDRTAVKIYDTFIFPISRVLDSAFSGLFGKNLMIVASRREDS